MSNKGAKIAYWGLFIALSSILISGDVVYFALFFTVLLTFSWVAATSSGIKSRLRPVNQFNLSRQGGVIEYLSLYYLSNCWWLIMLTWVYGFSLAMLLDVPLEHASRNFFGMVAYITLPLLIYTSFPIHKVFKLFTLAAFFQLVFLLFNSINSFDRFFTVGDFNSLSELRVTYSLGALLLIPILSVSAASLFYRNWRSRLPHHDKMLNALCSKTGMTILLFCIVVPSMSKGLFLISLLVILASFVPATFERIRKGFLPSYIFYSLALALLVIAITPESFWEVLFFTFSDEDLSNSIRNEQANYLIDEFSVFGSGLGSHLKSGFIRDETGYGFELNYLNIVHKLGVFSLPIFASYLATLFVVGIRIFRGYQLFHSYFALGLMGYLIQGAANPILLSPLSVMMHSFAIYILIYKGKRQGIPPLP